MMMRLLSPNPSVIAQCSRSLISSPRSSLAHFSLKHCYSVCAATKYNRSLSEYPYKGLDTRLLVPKANLLYRPSGIEGSVLLKYNSSLSSRKEFRTSYNCYDSILRNEAQPNHYFSTSSEKADDRREKDNEDLTKKLTIVQRFKAMLKDYWHVLIPVHVVTSIGWFGGFYYLATSGIDIPALMENLNFSETFVKPFRDSSMGYIAVAYGLYKIATPVRYTITVGGTSLAINVLKKRGLVGPWPINFKWLKSASRKRRTT